jgi:rhodanese-related sulfurtransferase
VNENCGAEKAEVEIRSVPDKDSTMANGRISTAALALFAFSIRSTRSFSISQTSFARKTAVHYPFLLHPRSLRTTSSVLMATQKAGVASPDELKNFVAAAGDSLVVIDTRNPDAASEPGDQKSFAVSGLPSQTHRPQAINLIWDRSSDSMPLPDLEKDTPIITHCGGGGRGQKAKEFLMKNGFTTVINGGGPKETECWNEFGGK